MGKRSGSGITSSGSGGGGGSATGPSRSAGNAPAQSTLPNAAQQNPTPQNTQPPVNSAPTPTGFQTLQNMSDDELATLATKSKTAQMPNQLSDVSDVTQRFVFTAGINDKPQVLDNSEFNTFMKDNNLTTSDLLSRDVNPVTYTNNSGTQVKMTSTDVADMMMYSRYNYIGGKQGGQAYGAGTYFDHTNGNSTGYGGSGSKTVVAVLNPATARSISSHNLASKARQFAQTHPNFAKAVGSYNSAFSGGKNNMAIYALAMGYNVITDGSSNGYVNVIDRSALVYRK